MATLFINCQAAPVSACLPPSSPTPLAHLRAAPNFNLPSHSLPSSSAHTKRFPFIRLAQAASIASSSSDGGGGSGSGTQKYLLYSYVFMFLMLLFLFLFALSMLLTLSAPLLLMLYTAQAELQWERESACFWALTLSLCLRLLSLSVLFPHTLFPPAALSLCTLLCIFVSAQKKWCHVCWFNGVARCCASLPFVVCRYSCLFVFFVITILRRCCYCASWQQQQRKTTKDEQK